MAIKQTQTSPGLKLRFKFLEPNRVVRTMRNDRYIVEKVGDPEGLQKTSTAADYMKMIISWLLQLAMNSEGE